ncbi:MULTISPECIES: JAB domain-containing protein [unclassified Pseudomonas]|uniref:JAB domain-containing protein n=2 Tax=unclassified Pseudomonas TaxID=196821 RepID=UPI002113B364|nr:MULTISPECIES: JAB domain-containing protein [unclassified Pseudomonas]
MTDTQLIAAMPVAAPLTYTEDEEFLIQEAINILERHVFKTGPALESPGDVYRFLQLKLGREDHEVFGVLFLDTRHRVLAFETLFHGTINALNVHPRRIVQRALEHNCAAVILVHNHPSGVTTPSSTDRQSLIKIKHLLAEMDIQLLDEFIVGHSDVYSFAEHGLI